MEEHIDHSNLWAYLDEDSHGNIHCTWACGIVHLSKVHVIILKVDLSEESNKFVELWALKLVLTLVI